EVDTPSRALHHRTGGHDASRDCLQMAVDHVGDEQLVRREVVLRLAVVPDVRLLVLLVGPSSASALLRTRDSAASPSHSRSRSARGRSWNAVTVMVVTCPGRPTGRLGRLGSGSV